jgi:LuxR family maltose regulon positive regulatory protein
MADQPVVAMAGAAVSRQHVLLATKLHVPSGRPGFVPRPRLVGRLEEGLARGLVLVCAPAGWGKTVLLADWARRGGRLVAWLSLDVDDNDPARFWRHVVAALGRARPGIAELAGPVLGPLQASSPDGLVMALINELAAEPRADEVLLVLDDYHLIDSQPVHGSLLFLLEHLPPGLRVVLSSRSDPPLPLARLRASGQLAELRAAELRFTADEAAALLREATGADLPGTAVTALTARTEGWAAGLQLAGLSLRGQADTAGFVAAFSGSHRYVLDYLTGEVLERQNPQVREFLLETSVLERLSGELCDAVTGRSGSQAMLQDVERAGLFLVPLDEVRGWWRYHRLFADLLRARLQEEQPGRVQALHRAAAAWSEEHDLADDAVRHALAAGDTAWAARLVERHVEELLGRSEGVTLRRWLSALPAESVRARPRLCLAQAYGAAQGFQLEALEALLDDAERAFAVSGDEPYEPSLGPPQGDSVLANVPAGIAFLRAALARLRGDVPRAAGYNRQALAHLGTGDWFMRSFVHWNQAVTDWLDGRLGPAEHSLAEVLAERRAVGAPFAGFLPMRVWYDLGEVQRAQGNLDAALATCRQALDAFGESSQTALTGPAHVGLAQVLYERNELTAALDHATRGVTLCRQLAFTPALATGLAVMARIRHAQGDAAGALEAMGEAGQAALSPQVITLFNPVPSQRAVLLAQDRPGQALTLLDRLLAQAATGGRIGSVIEVRALQALAHQASRDEPAATAVLVEALTLSCPQGYVRVFADEGPPMDALLGRLVAAHRARKPTARRIPVGCLARLVQAFDGKLNAAAALRPEPGTVPGLIEPLTGRELEVLRLLAAGKSNQRIAHDLFVALDTVKKHVTHVLGKLGAANRTEAVARARDLGLIP